MNQRGWKVGGSQTIDSLLYTYISNSNKLLNILDRKNDTLTRLGDFRSSTAYMAALSQSKSTGATDYSYDGNGNMYVDNNKDIGNIHYNYLNLPDSITVTNKGNIKYVYDATGNKLKKITTEGSKITTTLYLLGNYINDTLQFLPTEEGRARPKDSTAFVYDYFIKDHLGNVRMILTEERKIDKYPVVSMETAKLSIEKVFYTIDTTKITDAISVTGLPSYTNDNGIGNNPSDSSFETANSARLYKLNSTTNKTGLGMTLKVMAGDTINIFGKSYYFQNNTGGSGANSAVPILEILNGFIGNPTGALTATGHSEITGTQLNGISVTTAGIQNLLDNKTTDNNQNTQVPKAYINYLFFDEQFKCVGSGFSKVGSNSTIKDHYPELQNLAVSKNGYVYIYVSNESPVNVFFDNLQVVHSRGPLLEETHYYPFGLTMAGISSKALTFEKENRIRFNGYEQQNKEFSDGAGLDWYDYKHRFYDNQVGRFFTQDALADSFTYYSPYQFAGNEVPNAIDMDGLEPWNPFANVARKIKKEWNSYWRGEGTVYNTLDWFNRNLNPVGLIGHGAYQTATGKDLITGEEVSRIQGIANFSSGVFSSLPSVPYGDLHRRVWARIFFLLRQVQRPNSPSSLLNTTF